MIQKSLAFYNARLIYVVVNRVNELLQLSEVLDSTNHLRSIRVLIVVPRNYLYLICIVVDLANHCLSSIEERTETHTDDIRRNDRILVVTEALVRSSLHSSVDTLYSYVLTLNNSNEDSCRTCRSRNTLCRTNQLTIQLRDNQTDSLSSTSRVRNDVLSTCT